MRSSQPKWTRLSREIVLSTPYYDLAHERYVLPRGEIGEYHYLDVRGSAMVLPLLSNGELVLVRQHRYLFGRASLEFPAGGIQPGSDPLATARAELREEAGYLAERWEPLGEFAPCNGASNEICHVFLASGLHAVSAAPEATEELEVLALPPAALRLRIASGELWDGMTIAALAIYQAR